MAADESDPIVEPGLAPRRHDAFHGVLELGAKLQRSTALPFPHAPESEMRLKRPALRLPAQGFRRRFHRPVQRLECIALLDETEPQDPGSAQVRECPCTREAQAAGTVRGDGVAERLHEAIPGATLEIIDGARHFTPEDAPERVASAVANLLRR